LQREKIEGWVPSVSQRIHAIEVIGVVKLRENPERPLISPKGEILENKKS
jgi:hypothetical protein